ncbi:MAG: chemotaxis protein CheD [Brevundimonas sp.]|uniref:chemotaxis protein CheD n=1 Tax=Brevundimonas sp. TaxID=1871086 RepID=UPI0027328F2C|nr:chemotaxis protein CheD [Brevundimonas sp.]MBX9615139.1 chemotaxis protein CheD [Caulobacteraceae bacterium]MDP3406369.1 chemotaxis protein CheD [Brevundimonas sp.]
MPPGLEHIHERRVHVGQGSHEVSGDRSVIFSTILGSCVAACVRDPVIGVGGMNHFLLPEAPGGGAGDRRYGAQAMELLINGLLAMGARRDRLEAKVFGGARMTSAFNDIGGKNAEFVQRFLQEDGIPIISHSLGGTLARRIHYTPTTGAAAQHLVQDAAVLARERVVMVRKPERDSGAVELFD